MTWFICVLTSAESRETLLLCTCIFSMIIVSFFRLVTRGLAREKTYLYPVALSAVRSKEVVLLLNHCYCYSHCLWGFCVWSLFCNATLGILSCFSIISLRKREMVALRLCFSSYHVADFVSFLFLAEPWVGLDWGNFW